MLITGFEAFGKVEDNPSTHLARALDPAATILRVDWREVADFTRNLEGQTILALGVAVGRTEPTYELFAHNAASPRDDVDGDQWPFGEIVPGAPDSLGATLLTPGELQVLKMRTSYTPGGYLCNFILYGLLWQLRGAGARVGFVHVAPFDVCPEEVQLASLRELVSLIGNGGKDGVGSDGDVGTGCAEINSSSAMNISMDISSPSGHISNGPETEVSRDPIRHDPEITEPSQVP